MQNRLKKAALPLAAALSLTVVAPATMAALTPSFAGAVTVGTTQGCTPGYWKNHPQSWEEFSPNQTVSDAFRSPFRAGLPTDVTLMQALDGGGGSGVAGAQKILLRAAVASILNAAHDSLEFPLRRELAVEGYTFEGQPLVLFPVVQSVYNSGDRNRMLALAAELDRLNNLGCPL
jgi:hypothetical protein